MWHMQDGHFWGMHFLWWIFWVLILIAIFATLFGISARRNKKDTPLSILKKRFAKGEIDKEEYEERRKILQQDE